MVAYSFKRQFVRPIEGRTKQQTIREARKSPGRHARPGETLQLYFAQRSVHCRLIGLANCLSTKRVRLHLCENAIEFPDYSAGQMTFADDLDQLARRDGFASWIAMVAFWHEHHPAVRIFNGVLIDWGATFRLSVGH